MNTIRTNRAGHNASKLVQTHTPGPWYVETGADASAVRRVVAHDQSRAPYVAREICNLPARHDLEERACLEADARLIAAAPLMLEALREMRKFLAAQGCIDAPAFRLIDTTIVKATGG